MLIICMDMPQWATEYYVNAIHWQSFGKLFEKQKSVTNHKANTFKCYSRNVQGKNWTVTENNEQYFQV